MPDFRYVVQPLAREINFSEIVFVYPPASGGHARIRIFTPGHELPFAGHPVLGTAFVLAAPLQLGEGDRIVFGRMRQPIPRLEVFGATAELFAALGVGGSELPVEAYVNGPRHVYVALGSEAARAFSSRGWKGPGTGSSGSRWAAPPPSSPEASFGWGDRCVIVSILDIDVGYLKGELPWEPSR